MPSKTTRRDLLIASAAGLSALSTRSEAVPHDVQEEVEKQLAKPLTDQAKKLLKAAVQNNQNNSKQRLNFKLPENSEPCTIYVPAQVVKK